MAEYFQTLQDEVELVWKGTFNKSTISFLAVRYFAWVYLGILSSTLALLTQSQYCV